MAIRDLLVAFEDNTSLPVDLRTVANWIIAKRIQDEIEFIGVDLDTGVIRGFVHRFRYHKVPYAADATCAASIYYDRDQGEEWINIVVAKELLHLMNGNMAVKTKEQFDTLIKRLAMPRELKILLEDPDYAMIDKFGDATAAALLIPMEARRLLMAAYKSGELTDEDIAALAVVPVRYARMVMTDEWADVYNRMLELQA